MTDATRRDRAAAAPLPPHDGEQTDSPLSSSTVSPATWQHLLISARPGQLIVRLLGWTLLGLVGLVGALMVATNVPTLLAMFASSKPLTGDLVGGSDTTALAYFIVIVGVLGLSILLCTREGASAGITLTPRPAVSPLAAITNTIGWTVVTATSMLLFGIVSNAIAAALGVEQTTVGQQWTDLNVASRAWRSAYAGLTEELSYVALPFAIAAWFTTARSRRTRLLVFTGAAVAAMLMRVTIHAYQGPVHAYSAALWALVNVIVFLVARSVIPLIVAHFVYDFAIAGGLVRIDTALILGAAVSAVFLVIATPALVRGVPRSRRPRSRPRPPRPPAVPAAAPTMRRTLSAACWTVARRPALFVPLLAAVYLLILLDVAIFLWGTPWWQQCLIALPAAIITLLVGYTVRSLLTRRRIYASPDAQLAVDVTARGWYIADHIARPGTTGQGHQLRLQVRAALLEHADAAHVIIYAHTTSEKLAHAYKDDIPGLRIAARSGPKILLVRIPPPTTR